MCVNASLEVLWALNDKIHISLYQPPLTLESSFLSLPTL